MKVPNALTVWLCCKMVMKRTIFTSKIIHVKTEPFPLYFFGMARVEMGAGGKRGILQVVRKDKLKDISSLINMLLVILNNKNLQALSKMSLGEVSQHRQPTKFVSIWNQKCKHFVQMIYLFSTHMTSRMFSRPNEYFDESECGISWPGLFEADREPWWNKLELSSSPPTRDMLT